ncbi:MAG: glycosyltransferase family 1 protein [Planctomycetota bacterium]
MPNQTPNPTTRPILPRVVLDLEKLRHINCGLGQFCKHLANGILNAASLSIKPVFFMPPETVRYFKDGSVEQIDVSPWRKEMFTQLIRPLIKPFQREQRYDLWHVTNQMSKYLPVDPRVPVVLTIHDLNFLHDTSHKTRRRVAARKQADIQKKIDRAAAIVTDSTYVAEDIKEHMRVGRCPIYTVPLGLAVRPTASRLRPAVVPQRPFWLTVGNALAHKNFHVLFDLIDRMPNECLVVAGKKATPYGAFMESQILKKGLADRVILSGEVSDGDRQWLYENCKGLLFPSLTEGFGLPVLEAMQCGKPVFMSRCTSLPEIGGDLGFYWDSYDPAHMRDVLENGIKRIGRDSGFAAKLQAHADSFSWAKTTQGYLRVYETVLSKAAA